MTIYKEDQELAEQCGRLAQAARQADEWLGLNEALVGRDLAAHQAELRRAERLFKRCERAARRTMGAGVFGPSQSGKSYLISALASNSAGELWAVLGREEYDFISRINPAGGRESTGLVTRFTLKAPERIPEGFPVHIRLLSETDLVKILTNTYYADAEHKEQPDREALLKSLAELERRRESSPACELDINDLEDLEEYLGRNFRGKPRVQMLDPLYWERAIPLAPYLRARDRAELFGLIWNGLTPFTELLFTLSEALSALGRAEEAFCPLTALIPREKSIIDVATLSELAAPDDDLLELVSGTGRRASLPRAVAAALTAELSITMRDQPAPYFEHTDLLDFPGYRSRLKTEDIEREVAKPGLLEGFFLRGKVAYLFERFSADRELTSLLLCIAGGPQEVQDLPGVINEWIISTHGETPESRDRQSSALMFVLTKADMEFDEKAGAPDIGSRWDDRLESSLLNFFGKQYDWPRQWNSRGGFNNLFLLRNPNITFDKILEYDAGGRETGLRPGKEDYVAKLEKAFLESPGVRVHFADPAVSWRAFMQLGDGGVSLIRERLGPLCDPGLKRRQIRLSLAERLARLISRLRPYWRTDNKEEERRERHKLGLDLARIFLNLAQNQRFGQFLRLLTLRDQELYDLYFQTKYQMEQELAEPAPAQAEPQPLGARVSADDMFADLFGQAPPAETPAAGPKDEAQIFVARIERHWLKNLHALGEDPALGPHFDFPGRELAQFVHELSLGLARLGVRAEMEEALRQAARYANMDRERIIWKQASLAANQINAYLDWLGFDPRRKNEAERTVNLGGKSRTLFDPPPIFVGLPELSEDQTPYDRVFYTDWTAALVALVNDNLHADAYSNFDPAQNARLKEILDRLSPETLG